MGERELQSGLEELSDVRPLDILLLLDLGNSEDLDRPKSSSVSGSHVLVEGLDGVSSGELSELLVQVVSTGSRVVSEPDTEVLDLEGLLLVDLRGKGRKKMIDGQCLHSWSTSQNCCSKIPALARTAM